MPGGLRHRSVNPRLGSNQGDSERGLEGIAAPLHVPVWAARPRAEVMHPAEAFIRERIDPLRKKIDQLMAKMKLRTQKHAEQFCEISQARHMVVHRDHSRMTPIQMETDKVCWKDEFAISRHTNEGPYRTMPKDSGHVFSRRIKTLAISSCLLPEIWPQSLSSIRAQLASRKRAAEILCPF
ncbi:MAG TPA: hypothetical protein VMA37_06730 [Acetobacteraceae bacterium]|nr:hypothetical protein [Acetobacteraceae bacterium]